MYVAATTDSQQTVVKKDERYRSVTVFSAVDSHAACEMVIGSLFLDFCFQSCRT